MSPQASDEMYKEEDEELCISRKSNTFYDKESPRSMTDKEISVDPMSLKQSAVSEEVCRSPVLPIITPSKDPKSYLPLPLPPAKPKFVSCSLPSSATASPRSGSTLMKNLKKWRNQSQASHVTAGYLARRHSTAISNLTRRQESYLRRSKSCGEGRACAPSDEFEVGESKVSDAGHEEDEDDDDEESYCESESDTVGRKTSSSKEWDTNDKGFKCGALCMFLPGFGRGKPVRERKDEGEAVMGNGISRTVSLEKFECGSWSSSAIINDDKENGDSLHLYFDLPLELIRNTVNDAHSPVAAAFVFDKDRKGVLKCSTSRAAARTSSVSTRHVRFSTSTPMSYPASPSPCITPRLRKAREEFNAFLEAQSA